MDELVDGIRRLTLPLPMGAGHVHCYLLPGPDGWTLVDTGLGLPGPDERWSAFAAGLDAPVVRIVVTHFHPDHVGGTADAAAVTGAAVLQGEHDYEQCSRVWGRADWSDRLADYLVTHGMPEAEAAALRGEAKEFGPYIRFARDPLPLSAGEQLDGWKVYEFPGHADGHLCLLRDGILIAGDHLLPTITPTIGLYPESGADPLGDYLASLERTIELAPRLALPGHGEPILDPARRARQLIAHHKRRLDSAAAALGPVPVTAYEVSLALFGDRLSPGERRFAVAETLSHLERLVLEGRAGRSGDGDSLTYTSA